MHNKRYEQMHTMIHLYIPVVKFPLYIIFFFFYICATYIHHTIAPGATETRAVHRECDHFREKALRKIHARASEHRVHSPASFVALRIGAMYHFRSNNS